MLPLKPQDQDPEAWFDEPTIDEERPDDATADDSEPPQPPVPDPPQQRQSPFNPVLDPARRASLSPSAR